jgi:pimeloyl-ACP methyl ester carboxylesterase
MQGREFAQTDPFIMLADDRVDVPPETRAGGPHPHAGFEIVTFAVEGAARDRDEGLLRAGDALWMTAGSGVVHNEDVEPLGKLRILQLWTTLPSGSRWAPPRFAHMPFEKVPVRREPGIEAHVYSGTSGAVHASSHTYLPLTLVDVRLARDGAFEQELPPQDGYLFLDRTKFRESFAADVSADAAAFMADSQVPWGLEALNGAVTEPAWKTKPSWYLVSTDDRMIPPDAQRAMAKRAGSTVVEAKGSHAIYVSQPRTVADLIAKTASGVAVAAR